MNDSTNQYVSGEYFDKHEDWHLEDAPGKAQDLMLGLSSALRSSQNGSFRIADIGAGAGGVLVECIKALRLGAPDRQIEGVGFEISPQAVRIAKSNFPELDIRQKLFESGDGPFDVVIFADVLEHVENPWALMRNAARAARFMVIRQPLLENLSTFRSDNYKHQREEWGHIGFFTVRSFIDMAAATGWRPLQLSLQAPWELSGSSVRPSLLHRLLTRVNRPLASFIFSGFYLNGAFERN